MAMTESELFSKFFNDCKNGQLESIRMSLASNEQSNTSNGVATASCLINLSQPGEHDKTPLIIASENGHCDIVQLLLDYAADIQNCDIKCNTAVHHAVYQGHKEVLSLLIEICGTDILSVRGGGDNFNALDAAISEGNLDIVKILIKNGVDINLSDSTGITPLDYAAFEGHYEITKYLLEKGANIGCRDENGDTPLIGALAFGDSAIVVKDEAIQKELVGLLLEYGADIDEPNNEGLTPLMIAVEKSGERTGYFNDIVRQLVEYGANVNASSRVHGKTPWLMALECRNNDCFEIMKQSGRIDPNATHSTFHPSIDDGEDANPNGETLLHYHCSRGNEGIVKLLLDQGADPRLCNYNTTWYALPPLHVTLHRCYPPQKICKILLEYDYEKSNEDALAMKKALLTQTNSSGDNAIHVAARLGNSEIFSLFAQTAAEINIASTADSSATEVPLFAQTNADGDTPVVIAAANKHHEFVYCMLMYEGGCSVGIT